MTEIYSDNINDLSQCSQIDGYRIKVNSNGGMGGGSEIIYTDIYPKRLIETDLFEMVIDRKNDTRYINPKWVSNIDKGVIIQVPLSNGRVREHFVLKSDLKNIRFVNKHSTSTIKSINL